MYRHNQRQLEFEDFHLPFGGKLRSDNRWVKMAKFIPWDEFEKAYRKSFKNTRLRPPAKSVRVALGALITGDTQLVGRLAGAQKAVAHFHDHFSPLTGALLRWRARFHYRLLADVLRGAGLLGLLDVAQALFQFRIRCGQLLFDQPGESVVERR